MDYVFFWLGLAVVAGIVANSKGRTGFGWFLLGLLFPVLSIILIALLPSLAQPATQAGAIFAPAQDMKSCPKCAEAVKAAARICRYCGYEFAIADVDPNADLDRYDDYVFIRPYKPAFSSKTRYQAVIHSTARDFDSFNEARDHIRDFKRKICAANSRQEPPFN